MNRRCWIVTVACVVAGVCGQENTTTTLPPGETVCQEHLQTCTDKYDNSKKAVTDSRAYYDCVWEVPCIKHHRGYNDRLELLSEIDDILEAQHEDRGNWWEDGACCIYMSSITMIISLMATFKIFYDLIN